MYIPAKYEQLIELHVTDLIEEGGQLGRRCNIDGTARQVGGRAFPRREVIERPAPVARQDLERFPEEIFGRVNEFRHEEIEVVFDAFLEHVLLEQIVPYGDFRGDKIAETMIFTHRLFEVVSPDGKGWILFHDD